ncbi:MAG: hypothetical protein FJW39_16790 [Acidobacteria bacterium]|nr:hypothetical protein [Acidobacteriota bacterium]
MDVAPRLLLDAPDELLTFRLRRIGEGIGKVVYASPHWVVKRERKPSEVVALIVLWKALRKFEHALPFGLGDRLLAKPSRQLRFLRLVTQAAMRVVPRGFWFTTHVRDVWKLYHRRGMRGEALAREHLSGTDLVPETVSFPPVRVRVLGWPGWLTVSEATERVEAILYGHLRELARAGEFEEIERWLNRFLEVRVAGWSRGLFYVDAHLNNFGVLGGRIVLLDAGGVTNRWEDAERRLAMDEAVEQPHVQLGLGAMLAPRPDIAARFNEKWKSLVNRGQVLRHWEEAGRQ